MNTEWDFVGVSVSPQETVGWGKEGEERHHLTDMSLYTSVERLQLPSSV
jgi:hypothetical protein